MTKVTELAFTKLADENPAAEATDETSIGVGFVESVELKGTEASETVASTEIAVLEIS